MLVDEGSVTPPNDKRDDDGGNLAAVVTPASSPTKNSTSRWSPRRRKNAKNRIVKPVDLNDDDIVGDECGSPNTRQRETTRTWGDLRAKVLFRGFNNRSSGGGGVSSNRIASSSDSVNITTTGGEDYNHTDKRFNSGEQVGENDNNELVGTSNEAPPEEEEAELVSSIPTKSSRDEDGTGKGTNVATLPVVWRSSSTSPRVPNGLHYSPQIYHQQRRVRPVTDETNAQANDWGREFGALPAQTVVGHDRDSGDVGARSKVGQAARRKKRKDRSRNKDTKKKDKITTPLGGGSIHSAWGDLANLQDSFADLGGGGTTTHIPGGNVGDIPFADFFKKNVEGKDGTTQIDDDVVDDDFSKWKDLLSMATMDYTLSIDDFDPSSLNQLLGGAFASDRDMDGDANRIDGSSGLLVGADTNNNNCEEVEDDSLDTTDYNKWSIDVSTSSSMSGSLMRDTEDSPTSVSEDPMFKVMEQLLMDDGIEITDDTTNNEVTQEMKKIDEVVTDEDNHLHIKSEKGSANNDYTDEDDADSFGTAAETEVNFEANNSGYNRPSKRVIRFADEQGLPVATVMQLDSDYDQGPEMARIVILILSPRDRKFEFIHAEYQVGAKTTVQDVVEQIPRLAVDELFRQTRFTHLYRTCEGTAELINTLPMSDCGVEKTEVLVGIMKGCIGREIVQCALPLLVNPKIARAVKRARRSGRGLKYILMSTEWRDHKKENREIRKAQREVRRFPEEDQVPEMSKENTESSAATSDWNPQEESRATAIARTRTIPPPADVYVAPRESAESFVVLSKPGAPVIKADSAMSNSFATLTKPKPSIAVPNSSEATPTSSFAVLTKPGDDIPELPDMAQSDTDGPQQADKSQKAMQLLHAGLVATVGILYTFSGLNEQTRYASSSGKRRSRR